MCVCDYYGEKREKMKGKRKRKLFCACVWRQKKKKKKRQIERGMKIRIDYLFSAVWNESINKNTRRYMIQMQQKNAAISTNSQLQVKMYAKQKGKKGKGKKEPRKNE